ncbi:MAG: WcaI family glycosyltransferase [Bryobacteraceae bacterium]
MNLLVHTIFYAPDLVGVAPYTATLCEWLAARGHSVHVVAPPPYYPEWKIRPPYRSWTYSSELHNGVRVSRCPIWIPRNPRGAARLAYAASFALSSAFSLARRLARPPDVVFVIEPSLLNALPSLALARLTGAKAWLHIQDFEIDLAFDMGQLRPGVLQRLAAGVERALLRRFDLVSTISEPMLERAIAKGAPPERTELLPNWVDTDAISPAGPCGYRAELGIAPGKPVALFSGSMGAKQALDVLVAAARLLENSVDFVICGDGPMAPKVREWSRGFANVHLLPLQPAERLPELLRLADLHILTQQASAADRLMPSKLLGMLASGRPVAATVAPETAAGRIVRECGLLAEPGNPEALAAIVARLASDSELRARLGTAGRRLAKTRFGKAAVLDAFDAALTRLASAWYNRPRPI